MFLQLSKGTADIVVIYTFFCYNPMKNTRLQYFNKRKPMLNRQTLEKYILDTYGVSAEAPWIKYPDNTVYRHASNKKWFAVVMTLPKSKQSSTK